MSPNMVSESAGLLHSRRDSSLLERKMGQILWLLEGKLGQLKNWKAVTWILFNSKLPVAAALHYNLCLQGDMKTKKWTLKLQLSGQSHPTAFQEHPSMGLAKVVATMNFQTCLSSGVTSHCAEANPFPDPVRSCADSYPQNTIFQKQAALQKGSHVLHSGYMTCTGYMDLQDHLCQQKF